jgi:hypothetical protein
MGHHLDSSVERDTDRRGERQHVDDNGDVRVGGYGVGAA